MHARLLEDVRHHGQIEQAVMLGVELETLNAARQKLGAVIEDEEMGS